MGRPLGRWGDAASGAAPYLGDEPPPGLVALPVGGALLLLLQDALPAGAVLQGELPQQLADGHHLHVPHGADRVPQVQQEGVKPAGTPVTAGPSHHGWTTGPGVCSRRAAHLLRTRLWTTFKTTIRWVLSLRKSVSLLFSTGLVSCLAITFRLSQEAWQRRSSCTRLLASSSKSTWRREMSALGVVLVVGWRCGLWAWPHLRGACDGGDL